MIGRLFPPAVETEIAGLNDEWSGLLPAEEDSVRQALPKRRQDFALGRVCARLALARLGTPNFESRQFSVLPSGGMAVGVPDLARLVGRFSITPTHVLTGAVRPAHAAAIASV